MSAFPRVLRAAALIGLPVGALGSVALMLWVGRRNESHLLLALFAIWVLSPFVALAVTNAASSRWPPATQAALHGLILVLALGSLGVYGAVAFGPPRAQSAFAFVVVPPASWLLIAVVLTIARFLSHRASGRGTDA